MMLGTQGIKDAVKEGQIKVTRAKWHEEKRKMTIYLLIRN